MNVSETVVIVSEQAVCVWMWWCEGAVSVWCVDMMGGTTYASRTSHQERQGSCSASPRVCCQYSPTLCCISWVWASYNNNVRKGENDWRGSKSIVRLALLSLLLSITITSTPERKHERGMVRGRDTVTYTVLRAVGILAIIASSADMVGTKLVVEMGGKV